MPGRVNTKFVVTLSSVIVLLAMVAFGLWFMFDYRSAARTERRADAMAQEGELVLAYETYEKAIGKDQDNVRLLEKYLDVLGRVQARDAVDAQTYVGKTRSAMRMITDLRPYDDQALEDYYGYIVLLSRRLGSGYFDVLYESANAKLEGAPDNLVARKHRGIARVNRLRGDMSQEERDQARDDLTFVDEKQPGDPEVIHHLVLWYLFEADQLDRPGGQPVEAARLRELAVGESARALAENPDDPEQQIKHLSILLHPRLLPNNPRQAKEELRRRRAEAEPVAEALERSLLADPQPEQAVLGLTRVLRYLAATPLDPESDRAEPESVAAGDKRVAALLEAAVQAEPDNLAYRYELGRVLRQQNQTDEALAMFQQIRNTDVSGDPITTWIGQIMAGRASTEVGDLLLNKADLATDSDEKKKLQNQVKQIIDEVKASSGDSPGLQKLRGQWHFSRGEYREAAIELDKAVKNLAATSGGDQRTYLQALLLSSRAHMQARNWGEATDRLEQILALSPHETMIRRYLAEVYLQHSQLEKAEVLINGLLEAEPDNANVQLLHGRLLARQPERIEDAILIYEQLDPEVLALVSQQLAQLYLSNDQKDKAVRLLESQVAERPNDVQLLALLIAQVDDDARRLELIEAARQAGADADSLDLIARTMAGDGDPSMQFDEFVQARADREDDPFRKALVTAQLYHRTGQRDKALAALDEAAQLNPDHAAVIEMQFLYALLDQDFDRAQSLVDRASQLNLDLAQGAFYEGRLAAAQQEWRRAAAAYRRGLAAREVFSEGWRQLGFALARDQKLDEAAEAYQRAIDQMPDNVLALEGMARVQFARGDHDLGLENMRAAFRYQPNNRQILAAYLAAEQQFGDPSKAIEQRQKIAESSPQDTNNRRSLAVLLAQNERGDEALQIIDGLIAEEGKTRVNVGARAVIRSVTGDEAGGRAELEQYLAERGDEADVNDWATLARFLVSIGDVEGGYEAFRRAIALEDPQRRPVSRMLADLMFTQGRNEDAAELYRKIHAQSPDDEKVAMRLAETLIRLKRFDEADALLAQDRFEQSVDALTLRAMMETGRNDSQEALRLLGQAIRRDRNRAQLYIMRAQVLAPDKSRMTEVEEDLNEALRLDPTNATARFLLADVYLRRGNANEAIRELRTLLERDAEYLPARQRLIQLYRQQDNPAAARSLIDELVEMSPDDPRWQRLRIEQAVVEDDLPTAIELTRQMVGRSPTPQAVSLLAELLLRDDQPAAALDVLREHVEMVNRNVFMQALRGRALAATGETEQAGQVFARALERCGSYDQANAISATMIAALGAGPSLKLLEENIAEPLDPIMYGLLSARLHGDLGDHAAALQRLRSIQTQIPADNAAMTAGFNQMLAMALHNAGEYDEARALYEKLLADQPDNVSALNNLAYLLANDMGEPLTALPLAERAAELSDSNAQVLDTLGWVRFKADQPTEARATLERSLELRELAPTVMHLGAVNEYLGFPDKARELYLRAIELADTSNDRDTAEEARRRLEALGE